LAVACFCAIFALDSLGQTPPVTDSQFWPDVQVTKDLDKAEKWSGTLLLHGRFGNGLRTTTDARVGLTITRKLNKHFSVGGTYIYRYANSTFVSRSFSPRIAGFLQASPDLPAGFEIGGRSMLQRDLRHLREDETIWRNQARIRRKIDIGKSWIAPYLSYENFYNLSQNRHQRHREMIGIIRPVTKHLELDIYFLRQDDAATSRPRNVNAIGTSFRIKL
jgi:hypothetical protein